MSAERPSYWRRRVARHVKLAIVSLAIGAIVWSLTPHRSTAEGLSFATAYAGLVLLAAALAVGPINVLRRKANPVSTDVRRDVGIWAALCGIAHTLTGLQVHMHGEFARYFTPAAGANVDRSAKAFFTANYFGMAAAVLLLVLLLLSNDFSLRKLGVPTWKLFQRSTYFVLAFVALHAALYEALEKRTTLLIVVSAVTVLCVVALQVKGLRTRERQENGGRK